MSFARSCSLTVSLFALGLPALALAHTGIGHGFMQGVAHPLGGMDHLLAMVAVGLLAGRCGGAPQWQIPTSFIAMMACGTLIGMAAIPLPFIEAGIALSIVVFGLMLMSNRSPSLLLTTLAVGFFALFHGHAHGTEAAGNISGLAYATGLLSVSALLHACGALAAVLLIRTHRASALRLSGSVLAVAGVGIVAGLL
jgi:urease accessory protein